MSEVWGMGGMGKGKPVTIVTTMVTIMTTRMTTTIAMTMVTTMKTTIAMTIGNENDDGLRWRKLTMVLLTTMGTDGG
jgi:hypothetical protein